jgi:hypothetical protein
MGAREYLVIDPNAYAGRNLTDLGYTLEATTTPPHRGRTLAERSAAKLRAPVQVWSRPEWCDAAGKAVAELTTRAERRAHAKHGASCTTLDAAVPSEETSLEVLSLIAARAVTDLTSALPLDAVRTFDWERLSEREQDERPDPDEQDAADGAESSIERDEQEGDQVHHHLARFAATVRWLCNAERLAVDPDGRTEPRRVSLLPETLASLAHAATPHLERERADYLSKRQTLDTEMRTLAQRWSTYEQEALVAALAAPAARIASLIEPAQPTQWALDVAALVGAVPHRVVRTPIGEGAVERMRSIIDTHVSINWEALPSGSLQRLEDALTIAGAIDHAQTRVRFSAPTIHPDDAAERELLRKRLLWHASDLRD